MGIFGGALAALAFVATLGVVACSQSDDGGTGSTAKVEESGPADAGSPARTRLLTQVQYTNMVQDVFGADIKPGTPIPPFRRTDGLLELGAASVGVTAGQLMQFQRAAGIVANQVVDDGNIDRSLPSHRDYLVPCKPKDEKQADDACATQFIKSTGRLLFRRPLADAKVKLYVEQAHNAADKLKGFYPGLAAVVEGMLVDPMVLMVTDTTEPDPANPGRRRLDAYSMASRLSLFLWNSVPDDALLTAAEKGELNSPRGRAKAVDRMLASPRLDNGVRAFFDDMFAFDDFDNLSKDAMVYPKVSATVLKDAREQTLRTIVDQLIKKHRDYRDLFTTRETFMSPALAAVYEVPVQPGWTPYTFPADSPRVGLLSQVSFLAVHSHPARSSATLRGKALRELLLCQKVPSPPPNVDFSIVEDPKANFHTARERLTAHRNNPVCAGCHRITDPMGLALENFDGGGQYRTAERGTVIDASGTLDGKEFKDVNGLEQALHDHPSLPSCLVKRVYAYGTGGPLTAADDPELAYLNQRFQTAGYRLPDLLRAIVLSTAFADVSEPPAAPPATKTADASAK